jgi:hypothetical protein
MKFKSSILITINVVLLVGLMLATPTPRSTLNTKPSTSARWAALRRMAQGMGSEASS